MKFSSRTALPALFAVCLAASSCGSSGSDATPAASTTVAAQTLPQVDVVAVKSKRLDATVSLPAELAPYESVDLYAKESGFVKSIPVDRGSRVKQGELIAELEAPELGARHAQAEAAYQSAQSQLASAKAKLASDQATYRRMAAAAKMPGVVSGNDLDVAQKAAQADEANVAALQQDVDGAQNGVRASAQLEAYLRITAPFDGQITARYVHPGALAGPAGAPGGAAPIAHLETLNRHRLVVPVPENYVAGVAEGAMVGFTVPSFPGRTFRAPIAGISHDVDTKTRTMPVELDVRDPRGELVPGTYCQVEWPVHRTYPTLVVPTMAVASDLERNFVIRVRNNRTEWVDVRTGLTTPDGIEVFGDLREGDMVAARGTDQLRAGVQVSPKLATAK
jgi:RND family efflux transporter MFP subunit